MNISQEDFNTVLFGIRQQGGPSLSHRGYCKYRGEHGRKCAAGWLIPDEKYRPELDDSGFLTALSDSVSNLLGTRDILAVRQLQRIHDDSAIEEQKNVSDDEFFRRWEPQMRAFAAERALTYAPPVSP